MNYDFYNKSVSFLASILTVAGALMRDLKLYGDCDTRRLKSFDLLITKLCELTDPIARLAVLPIPAP